MLDCKSHVDNPIEKSRACNGFVVKCLHQLPLEVFSKNTRELILKSWPPESPDPAHNDSRALSYRMTTLDPAVLSLKAKMMERPTLYEVSSHATPATPALTDCLKGIEFQDLVDLAGHVVSLCSEPDVILPIFARLAKLTLR